MRCRSVHRRFTSEARRLSTHFALFPCRSWRRSLGIGRLPVVPSSVFSGSSLMDFTGLSVLSLLLGAHRYWRLGGFLRFDRGCLETPGVRHGCVEWLVTTKAS